MESRSDDPAMLKLPNSPLYHQAPVREVLWVVCPQTVYRDCRQQGKNSWKWKRDEGFGNATTYMSTNIKPEILRWAYVSRAGCYMQTLEHMVKEKLQSVFTRL